MNVVIWGTGKKALWVELHIKDKVEIKGIIDSDKNKVGKFYLINNMQYPILAPDGINDLECDYLIVAVENEKYCAEIQNQLNNLGFDDSKVIFVSKIEQYDDVVIEELFNSEALDKCNEGFFFINGKRMVCPKDYPLVRFKKEHFMYDEFLPVLVSNAKADGVIIDIGANIGDTCVALSKHRNMKFVCVEPSYYFYEMLVNNTDELRTEKRIAYEKAFVSNKSGNYVAELKNGTGIMRQDAAGAESENKTLDMIINDNEIDYNELFLIKIDTDGYDGSVLLSGKDVLKRGSAILFWENQIDTYEQYSDYKDAYDLLSYSGYTTYFVFDNRGNYLCDGGIDNVRDICDYLQRIKTGWSTKTFEYVDVMACKNNEIPICLAAKDEYLKRYKYPVIIDDRN
ncbi:MAG: FkbM family methyltransferase [Lachnospiraceae bacterium]|nr:FkbM family methyltransferase [Lachnospiraceae bacterium]